MSKWHQALIILASVLENRRVAEIWERERAPGLKRRNIPRGITYQEE